MSDTWVTASDGVRLSVSTSGPESGPVVVCVHGYPDNSTLWDGVAAALPESYRVVSYDVRGAGASDRPSRRAAYRLDQLADDLTRVVDAVAGEQKVHLLAHDWGSVQTWHAVTGEWLRGRVASYTSMSGPCLDHAGEWFRERLRGGRRGVREALNQFVHSTYIAFFQLPVLPELAWRSGLLARVVRRFDPSEPTPVTADAVAGLELYRANMLPRLGKPQHRFTDVPVQVLAPTADRFVTESLQSGIERWVSDLRVRRVRGGHWLPRHNPRLVADAVAEFVGRHS